MHRASLQNAALEIQNRDQTTVLKKQQLQAISGAFMCGYKHHCQYHCLDGLSTNLVCWGKCGKRLARPYPVPSDKWHEFAVHHLDWKSTNVAQASLAPMLEEDHRSLLSGQKLQGKLLQRA